MSSNHHGLAQVLLVEDNPGDIQLTREAFSEMGKAYTLHVVEDGEQALDFLTKPQNGASPVRPDLILLDLNLPKKTGIEVLQVIKTDDRLKSIPVVVLTTSNHKDDITKAYALHANCYINKPVDLNDFFKVIHRLTEFWLDIVRRPTPTESV